MNSDELQITWLGHAALLLRGRNTTILVDPFLSGNPTAVTSADELSPDLILITHAHNDHVGDALAISQRVGCRVVTTVELADYLGAQGAQVFGANIGGTVEFDGGSVKLVPAVHSSSYQVDGRTEATGVACGLLVRLGSKTVYVAGDTALFGDMALIGEEDIDVAVLPIGGHYTMDPKDAVRAVRLLRPGIVIPYHFDTFPLIAQKSGSFAVDIAAGTDARCVVLELGGSLSI